MSTTAGAKAQAASSTGVNARMANGRTLTRKRLPNIKLSPLNRPLDYWAGSHVAADIDLAAPYQRGSVWGLERRRELVKSLLIGLPVGSVIVSELRYRHGKPCVRVVDGKQRLETVLAFIAGEFTVPGWWFPADDLAEEAVDKEEVGYGDLSQKGRFRFGNLPLPALELNGQTEHMYRGDDGNWVTRERSDEEILALEAGLYELVNFAGMAQTESDREQARQVAAHPERYQRKGSHA